MKKINVLLEDLDEIVNDNGINFYQIKNSTVFITGVTGLIGSLLVRTLLYANNKLNLDIQIIGLARSREKVELIYGKDDIENFSVVYGDVTDSYQTYLRLDKIDYVFHTACVTASKTMVSNPVDTIMTAIEGTNQILRLAYDKKAKSMIYVSSMEMYGIFDSKDNISVYCDENTLGYINPLKIRSNYPEGKRMCENLCVAYASQYNVPVKIARLAQTFGAGILPWENRVFAQFCRSAINKKDIVLHTKGLSEGNYCYSSDAIRALFVILLSGNVAEAYNVVNENTHTTIAHMAEMVCKDIAKNKIKVVFDIPDNVNFGYAPDTKMKLSNEKIMSLGWRPNKDLKQMYERTIEYMLENSI